ncbi:MAG: sterol desaturase family protein [Chitinophagales bacterium]
MDNTLFGIPNLDVYIILGILVIFGLMEMMAGYLHRTNRTSNDWIQEAGGFFMLSVAIKPLIVLTVLGLGSALLSQYQGIISHWSIWAMLPFYLFIDDLLQYWYHRSAHEYEFLWKLHRPHHQAEEMGFFISYRNAALYYLIMPNIWWIGIVTFLGGGKGVALGLILKQIVIIGSHSTIKWDSFLYKYKFFNPLTTILERIIITPAFHHAHHGKSMRDSISDPNGNFGNMFSIWDQLFGTAKFTRQFPEEYGILNDPKEHWSAAYLYPLVAAEDPKSEISRGFQKNKTATPEPIYVELEKGEKYLWCQCGKSQNQPFCDGMHHGSKFKPLLFEAKKTGQVKLCNCKITKKGPFCDNSHLDLLK